MDIVFGPDKEVKRMDGDLGGIGILLLSTLAAVGAGESAAEIAPRRIVVFAPIGGMRNPERLTDEEGKALILGTLPPGEYDAEFRTVLYRGADSFERPVTLLVAWDTFRSMWVGKAPRQWEEDRVAWKWKGGPDENDKSG